MLGFHSDISNPKIDPFSTYAHFSNPADKEGSERAISGKESLSGKDGDPSVAKNRGLGKEFQVKEGYRSSPAECKTCRERKYKDGSDEGDVSFKAPGHISPQASAATVAAHEHEHVVNAHQKAAQNNGVVLNCSVSMQTAICPECGTSYVSGGLTRTAIAYPNESNPYQSDRKSKDAVHYVGANFDDKS